MTKRLVFPVIAVLIAWLCLAAVAQAAFPGQNGKLSLNHISDILGELQGGFTMNADGSERTMVAESLFGTHMRWSPDGSRLLFARDGDIYRMSPDGSGETRLTAGAQATDPTWSPDGSKVVFASRRGGDGDIFVMDADGSNQQDISQNASHEAFPVWSPVGDRIAFERGGDVWVMGVDGTGALNVTAEDPLEAEFGQFDTSPSWSPDGSRIAFHKLIPCACADGDSHQIRTVASTGGTQSSVLASAAEYPAWSPDGALIAFNSINNRYGMRVIHTMPPAGGPATPVYLPPGGPRPGGPQDYRADWQSLPSAPPPLEPKRRDYRNASHYCKALAEFLGDTEFGRRFRNHGRCVSENR